MSERLSVWAFPDLQESSTEEKDELALKFDKFYIIAMAATGKSTFTGDHPIYRGYQTVDLAERLPTVSRVTSLILYLSRVVKPLRKLARRQPDMLARRQENYFSDVFEFVLGKKEPVVVFGRKPPSAFRELPVHDKIKFAIVLIPEEDHRRNCASRKSDLRNPLPMFHHWTTDFSKIQENRRKLEDYAKQHDIPVYESFVGAIDDMHERFSAE